MSNAMTLPEMIEAQRDLYREQEKIKKDLVKIARKAMKSLDKVERMQECNLEMIEYIEDEYKCFLAEEEALQETNFLFSQPKCD